MLNIQIRTIPHDRQIYETCGDWRFIDDTLYIYVSDLGNWKMEALIGLHEAIEALLCKDRGIDEPSVSNFDIEFEKNRTDNSEPGDDDNSPYKKEHFFATNIERLLCDQFNINWNEYDKTCNKLYE